MKPRYEELTFANNFMFCNVLQNNPELLQEVVESILDVEIREIIKISQEESLDVNYSGHGIRMDVYIEGDDALYDIELQTSDTGSLRKRSRYYQSVLDTDFLDSGADYNQLKKSYIIFVCTFDMFGMGLSKYTFRNRCDENYEILLNDETVKIFVNTTGVIETASPKFREFVRYLADGSVTGEMAKKIDRNVKRALKNERMRAKYMTFEWELATKYREGREAGLEEGRAEGRAEGLAKGIEEGRAEGLAKGIEEGRAIGIKEGRHEARLDAVRKLKEVYNMSDEEILSLGLELDEDISVVKEVIAEYHAEIKSSADTQIH